MSEKKGWEGRFFEDFEVGDVYKGRIGRTITQSDNIWFTLLTNNTNQIHFNNDFARRTEFGKCLINSTLTLAIVTGALWSFSAHGRFWTWDAKSLSAAAAWVLYVAILVARHRSGWDAPPVARVA